MKDKKEKIEAFHLIETMTGKTAARAVDPALFRNVISSAEARRYTIHNEIEGWFEPASNLFKEVPSE